MVRLKMLSFALLATMLIAACTPQVAQQPTSTVAPTTAAMAATATPTAQVLPSQMTPVATAAATPVATPAAATPAASAATPAATAKPVATVAAGQPAVMVAKDPRLGDIIVAPDGMTLYLYTRDEPNVTNCYDQCAVAWPPLLIASGEPTAPAGLPGTLGTTTRRDGSRQVTYNGAPLYYWQRDAKPGDTTGQNVGGVWFVMPPGTVGLPLVKTATSQSLGVYLTDKPGMTLYRFTNDKTPGQSACYDACATNWPPLLSDAAPTLAGGVPGMLGTITRTDGKKQVTYNGMPLYFFARDAKAGDTTGQGVNNVWFVVEPKAP